MQNRLKHLLETGQLAIGAQLRFGSSAIAEQFSHAGYDWLVVDTEHAPQTPPGVQAQLQAIGNTPATPVVRLPKVDEEQIRLYLDMGAMGIMAAMVNTAEQAEIGARACRYPPQGSRGFGPHRAWRYGFGAEDYRRDINDHVMFIPMIETTEAVANIDDILAVPGVDAIVLGPADLTYSLGVPFDFDSKVFRDAETKVLSAARRAEKPVGGGPYGSPLDLEPLTEVIERGFQAILLGGDEFLLKVACERALDNVNKVRK